MLRFIKNILCGGLIGAIILFCLVTYLIITLLDFVGGILDCIIRYTLGLATACYPLTLILLIIAGIYLHKKIKAKRMSITD